MSLNVCHSVDSSTSAEQYILKSENHSHFLSSVLKTFACNGLLTDITFDCVTVTVHAHQSVISILSSSASDFVPKYPQNCCVLLDLNKFAMLSALIEFVYSGLTTIKKDQINLFYELAKCLKLNVFNDIVVECLDDVSYINMPNHQYRFIKHLWHSRLDPQQCDTVLVTCDYSETFAHSFVLAANSKLFYEVFAKNSYSRTKPFVFIFQNCKIEHVNMVLEFCYNGHVSVPSQDLRNVYDVARLLGVEILCEKLLGFNHICSDVHLSEEIRQMRNKSKVRSILRAKHYHQVSSFFLKLLESECLTDISLLKDDKILKAHSIVLCAFSKYFQTLVAKLKYKLYGAFIFVDDLDFEELQAFLEYIYQGEAKFLGNAVDFSVTMSNWIDFDVSPITDTYSCLDATHSQVMENSMQNIDPSAATDDISQAELLTSNGDESVEDNRIDSTHTVTLDVSHELNCDIDVQPSTLINSASSQNDTLTDAHPGSFSSRKTEPEVQEESVKCEVFDAAANDSHMSDHDSFTQNNEHADDDEGADDLLAYPENVDSERKKGHTCYTCNETFVFRYEFKKHLIIHPEGRQMKCKYCSKIFLKPSELKQHTNKHTGHCPYQCLTCGMMFSAKSSMKKHLQIHLSDSSKLFKCDICKKCFSRKEYLMEHIRTHTGEKPFHCPLCPKSFVGRTGLNHHKKTHEEPSKKKNAICDICGKSFTKHGLWTHMKFHNKVFRCSVCSKHFATTTALKLHMGVHSDKKDFECETCGKRFSQKNSLNNHMRFYKSSECDKGKTVSCSECNKTFRTPQKLECHTNVIHKQPRNLLPYSCDICHKRFAGRSSIIYHKRSHSGERPHTCSVCDKTFTRPDALRQHMTSHSNERLHQCNICKKKYSSKSALSKHANFHKKECDINSLNSSVNCTDTFHLQCDICKKAFSSEIELVTHSRTHANARPFRCATCRKSFRYEDSLNKHIRVHAMPAALNELHCLYTLQVCGQSVEQVTEIQREDQIADDTEHGNNSNSENTTVQETNNSETQQQYLVSPLIISDCTYLETDRISKPVARRPYSITIDGNLCCNTEERFADAAPQEENYLALLQTSVLKTWPS